MVDIIVKFGLSFNGVIQVFPSYGGAATFIRYKDTSHRTPDNRLVSIRGADLAVASMYIRLTA